jgi:D-alanyl-D-alanine carboxypeptidase/D-alanyl-D-alanine-endopeptidase (penicillin-binding protein 4)
VRVDRAFDAPVSAMSFNWNSVNVFIRPSKVGEKLSVFLDPQTDYFELENKTKTVAKNGINSLDVTRIKTNKGDKIIVTGSLSANSKEIVIYKSISHPAIWTGEHLKQFLSQRGITLKGQVKQMNCEEGSNLLASVSSKNLNEMTSDMLKFSNNFVAEMLVKNLAAEQKNAPLATMKEGIEILKSYLDQVGLNRKDYNLVNVSGLTRDNQFTAKQLADVLINIKNNFLIYPEFLSALPIPGVDGTMKNRLKNDDGKWVRAKTGYLDGVVGLAGYIGRKNKGPLVFVFLFNGGYDQGLASRAFFDDIILKVINQ